MSTFLLVEVDVKYLQDPNSSIDLYLYIPIPYNLLLLLYLSHINTYLSYIIPRQIDLIQSTCQTLEYMPFTAISSHFKPYNLQGCIFYNVAPVQVFIIDLKVKICYNYRRQEVTLKAHRTFTTNTQS